MIIGTTPTFTLKLKHSQNVDLTQVTNIYVTLKQGSLVINKTGDNISVIDSKTIQFSLTQEESLSLALDKKVELQLNWTYSTQHGLKRAATKIISIELEKQLLNQSLT